MKKNNRVASNKTNHKKKKKKKIKKMKKKMTAITMKPFIQISDYT